MDSWKRSPGREAEHASRYMRIALLLIASLFAILSHAECQYSNYALTLKLTTTSGEQLIRYRTISACDLELDSIGSNAYLQGVLFNTGLASEAKWYAHRAAYRYCVNDELACAEDEKATLYHLFDGRALEQGSIRRIEVLEQVLVSALNGISTDLELADTVLFHQEPIEIISCGGYLCYHRIAIYKHRPEVGAVLDAISALNAEMEGVENGLDRSNGDAYDARMWELIEQLRTARELIVVSECTD